MAPKRTRNVKLKMSIIRAGQQLRNAVSMLLVPREQKRFKQALKKTDSAITHFTLKV